MERCIKRTGKVWLIGAGPGDPGLMTVNAKKALEGAEVVVFDYLANPRILAWAPPGIQTVDVGKRAGNHKMNQSDINSLLVRLGKSKRVARLKGGDPFVFGRGGEEAQALAKAGVPFEVVPGISSGIAGPAYAGIPVTHRGVATNVTFSTGQESAGRPLSAGALKNLARLSGTLVLFMSQNNIERICKGLIKAGKPANTPVAAIHKGTYPGQRSMVTQLGTLAKDVEAFGYGSPMLFVIGAVAKFKESLQWFENRPLFGSRILVTSIEGQPSRLVQVLEDLGAQVIDAPVMRLKPLAATADFKRAVNILAKQDWLIVTSAYGVNLFFDRLFKLKVDTRVLGTVKVAAIGPATAAALKSRGILADLVPSDTRAEGLLAALKKKTRKLKGLKITLARAKKGRDLLPEALKAAGAKVTDLKLYDTVSTGYDTRPALEIARQGELDLVTFSSAATVTNLMESLSERERSEFARLTDAACIGPVTAASARKQGFEIAIQSSKASIELLAKNIKSWWR